MRFFICDDHKKFTKTEFVSFGRWHFYYDDKVSVYKGKDFIVLYSGYLIEGDIEEVASNFSFHDANGNFFAVKLTKTDYEISVDYFNNHKIFTADKYGIEITNHLPYMTINEDDVIEDTSHLKYCPYRREISPNQQTTFFNHIKSFLPDYNYIDDCKQALRQDVWDVDELTDYIHECMLQHAQVIKDKYKKRFISLSEGIDSAVQSQYFKDDPQYLYHIYPCDAGMDGQVYKRLAQENFDDTHMFMYEPSRSEEYTHTYLRDSSTRWGSILPTMLQVEEANPDIVLYGVNGDEMFFRDLFPHLHLLAMKYHDKSGWYIHNKIVDDLENKRGQYGANYTLGTYKTTDDYVEQFVNYCLRSGMNRDTIEYTMHLHMTPKMYTRAISCNNDVITASLYNDRRIYHEVFKLNTEFLEEYAMDSPIQRKILEKFGYKFTTPHKDVLYADYDGILNNIFSATVPSCMEQNI